MTKKKTQGGRYLPQSRSNQAADPKGSYILSAVIGFAIFLAIMLLLGFLGSLLISNSEDPSTLIPFVSTVSMTVASLVGSIITAKRSGGSGGISSLVFIGIITLSVLLITVIHLKNGNDAPIWQSLLLKLPVILGAFFGGFVGSIKKKPKSLYAKYK